jgi:DNA-binding response OmpR family regulator
MRILLVEDDPTIADTLAKLLTKSAGDVNAISIIRAGTLREGIRKSNEHQVDVTYLDLCLPDSHDWQETAHAIRKFYPPVIIVTGLDDPDGSIKLECFTHGAQNFFVKPKDMKLLVPHLLSSGAAAHLRREAPKRLANGAT